MILSGEHLVLLASLQVAMRTETVISPRYLCRLYPYMSKFFIYLNIRDRYSLLYALNRHPQKKYIRETLDNYIDKWVDLGSVQKNIGRPEKELPTELTSAVAAICANEKLIKNGKMKHKGWNKLFHSLEAAGISFQPNTVRYYVSKSLLLGDNTCR